MVSVYKKSYGMVIINKIIQTSLIITIGSFSIIMARLYEICFIGHGTINPGNISFIEAFIKAVITISVYIELLISIIYVESAICFWQCSISSTDSYSAIKTIVAVFL
ncbi:hypothetical protein D3C87_1630930 [compost metagenome]